MTNMPQQKTVANSSSSKADTPMEWLSKLSSSLASAKTKLSGEPCSADRAMARIQELLVETRTNGGTVFWVGNGGSLALCSHLSQDVLNKIKVRSMVFSDAAQLTCMANDFGYEEVFARPLRTWVTGKDLLIAVSSSGKSKSILNAVDVCQTQGARVVALSAFSPENPLFQKATDVGVVLPTDLYGIAEVGHEAFLHAAIETLFLHESR